MACETRESRRGKHPRPTKKRRESAAPSSGGADALAASRVLASLHRDGEGSSKEGPSPQGLGHDDLESHSSQDPRLDEDNVFLGETNLLRFVSDGTPASMHPGPVTAATARLRYLVPSFAKAEALVPQWEFDRRRVRLDYLHANGAFSLPVPHVTETLLKAYFDHFHPCFAVVDEVDIWAQYRKGALSPLLLQAMLFIGSLHCDEPILQEVGFDSRHRAKYVFFNRAKDIYDAEFERKKITIIQALFLMSFWRAGALLEKDTRHWLGSAITLAQTKALHRSAGKAETQNAKLKRRIWWSLYTRDRQCAAALGLPDRVRDEDCDFEALEISDFDFAFGPAVPKRQAMEYANYALVMAQLATQLGRIVHSGYLPNQAFSDSHTAQMKEQLLELKQRLPPPKQHGDAISTQSSFFSNMLRLAYNNLLILLYRHDYVVNGEGGRESDGNIVLQTAAENSRIIEDMLAEGNLHHGQIHVITNLFNTLCIHTVHLRRSDGTTKTVAEHRAKLCLLGLQELQKTWEVTNWVLSLFFAYLDNSTAARLRLQEDSHLLNTGSSISKITTPVLPQATGFEMPRRTGPPIAIPGGEVIPQLTDDMQLAPGSWAWTSEEANQFLFSQIEDQFAFGEGEMLDWSPEETATMHHEFYPRDMEQKQPMP